MDEYHHDLMQEECVHWWQTVGQWEALEAAATLDAQRQPLRQDEDKHMRLNDMIESKYLKQSDIDGVVLVTVKSLKKVNVARDDEDPEYRWTVTYEEFPKPMVLNVTNLKRLGKYLGDDTEEWLGKQVELYVDPDIEFGGNVVGGLRIRGIAKKGQPKRAIHKDDLDSDIPFS